MNTTMHVDRSRYPSTSATSVIEKSQSNFFRQRAQSHLKAADKVNLRPDDINQNMAFMEQKLRDIGHVRRKSSNSSMLQRHKPASSMLLDDSNLNYADRRSMMTA